MSLGHELVGEDGEVVLTLNGGMMTHISWRPVTHSWNGEYRLLGCDFRGQLMTPGEAHSRIEDNVADIVELLDRLALDRVHVVGTSFGGLVGLLLAARRPERVRTLTVVASVDRTPPGMADDARALQEVVDRVLAGGDVAEFHDFVVRDVYSESYVATHVEEIAERRRTKIPAIWLRGVRGILDAITDFDLRDEIPEISCPTLILHAALDQVMPRDHVEALATSIPGAIFEVHPSAGHAVVVEDPDWLGERIGVFLDQHASQGES